MIISKCAMNACNLETFRAI